MNRRNDPNYEKLTKVAGLNSTATGYEIWFEVSDQNGYIIRRTVRTAHAVDMKRFYTLSGGYTTYVTEPYVHYRRIYRMKQAANR